MTTQPAHTIYRALPPMAVLYLRALRKPSASLPDDTRLPCLSLTVQYMRVNADTVYHYRKLFGFRNEQVVPLTVFSMLAERVTLLLMTRSEFPLRVVGLVYRAHAVSMQREVSTGSPLALSTYCHITSDEIIPAGHQFTLETRFSSGGVPIAVCTSTYVARRGGRRGSSVPPHSALVDAERVVWSLPGGLGRRYAALSGDYNPIHLMPLTAQLFGFRRHIAHGLGLVARTAAHIGAKRHIAVSFKRPVYLPATVELRSQPKGDHTHFELWSAQGETLHLTGHARG